MISEKNDFLSPQENLISRCEITIENAKKITFYQILLH